MNVREASVLMGAQASAVSVELFDKCIKDFSIDSRSVSAGELFFALSQVDYARAGLTVLSSMDTNSSLTHLNTTRLLLLLVPIAWPVMRS